MLSTPMAEQLINEFTINRPIDEAWLIITDVERIAPCLPGAQLTEIRQTDDGHDDCKPDYQITNNLTGGFPPICAYHVCSPIFTPVRYVFENSS